MIQRFYICQICTSSFMKHISHHRAKLPNAVFKISSRNTHDVHWDYTNVNLWKKISSTVLFAGTLTAVLLAKRHREKKLKELIEDCRLLPADYNYVNPKMFYLYKDYVLPDFVVHQRNEVRKFQVRESDVFVVAFPKTGTTWIQEIVYLVATDLDFEGAKAQGIESRFPYLEYVYPGLNSVEKLPSPRMIKTHLPYSLLPESIKEKNPKIICVLRNPKDVSVSFYHFVRMLSPTSYNGTFEEFFETLLKDKVMYGPLWKHYLETWEHRDDSNVLILKYEDMHKDIRSCIEKICQFLGKSLTETETNAIIAHCTFENMSNNPSVNYQYWDEIGLHNKNEAPFMRKGEVGDWKNYFTAEMNERMDKWIDDYFTPVGLRFCYSLDQEK